MTKSKIYLLFTTIVIAALLLVSCGENTDAESVIQTSVAETVAAQPPLVITETPPAVTLVPTQTPFAQPTVSTLPPTPTLSTASSSKAECAKASLQDETIVDGKIFKPGAEFTKTWYITNVSTCVWDTTYKIIFWDGNPLGGAYVYNLPQITGTRSDRARLARAHRSARGRDLPLRVETANSR
ncbi:MAG: hypothetical protein HND47_01165 [Chloroflexi bacterium]|nr:hypothetical protein [Chloroflexota bacterium]